MYLFPHLFQSLLVIKLCTMALSLCLPTVTAGLSPRICGYSLTVTSSKITFFKSNSSLDVSPHVSFFKQLLRYGYWYLDLELVLVGMLVYFGNNRNYADCFEADERVRLSTFCSSWSLSRSSYGGIGCRFILWLKNYLTGVPTE